ncbi:MAG TPA: Fic family protein, partial [Acidimicrobiales bacterium]|nr:Fic family protein [Acidimicrobiales bacterium]
MDIRALEHSPIGSLVSISGTDPRTMERYDHFAFLPDPLPDRISLEQETWGCVAAAARSMGQLKQVCAHLPNPRLLIAPALAKEAQATSALEGTVGALPEVLESRLPGFEPRTPEIREINGYERMARLGFEWVIDRPITVAMLCDLQKVLAEASQKRPPDPGRLRTHQVAIGPEGCSVPEARFVPPPPGDHLQAGLDAWQKWINTDHGLDPIVAAALAHYQFETLHPFGDGNGRVGRLVILLQFLRSGLIETPAFTISAWLLRRRDAYQSGLFAVSSTGAWDPWVEFFALAVKEQCDRHVSVAAQLLEWQGRIRQILNSRRWTGNIIDVAEELIDWPIITASVVQSNHGVSNPTAQRSIDRLVEVGALQELTGGRYARIYGATEVMALV